MVEQQDSNYTRILWRAHRGMLELDLFLIPFIEQQWHQLSEQQQQDVEQLFQCQDPQLLAWLMGHEVPEQQEFQHLVHIIRQFKQS